MKACSEDRVVEAEKEDAWNELDEEQKQERGLAHGWSHIAKGENIVSMSFQSKETNSQLCSR